MRALRGTTAYLDTVADAGAYLKKEEGELFMANAISTVKKK